MTTLQERPARPIVRAIADAARRWTDADFPARVRVLARIVERTGYGEPVVEYALDRLFESITQDALLAVIESELGDIGALDGFASRRGRPRARALPIGAVAVISSRTTIGVAILPAILALCAKNDVTVKDREDGLAAAFFATLAQEDLAFASAARAHPWDGAQAEPSLAGFDAVVAFGSDATLAEIRARCAPSATFIGFGAKASIGYVTRDALADVTRAEGVANGAARDLVLYDSQGCLSLHALFVERGAATSPERFVALLAAHVERAAVEFPLGQRTVKDLGALASARAMATFHAASGGGAAFYDEGGSYLLELDPPQTDLPFFLPRALPIHTVGGPNEVAAYLARHRLSVEALATDRTREDIVTMAAQAGIARIARFGDLQSPLLAANHGGRARIGEFVRWMTDET
ncbi:MAG TPA: acyl-CoA reductase [Candidatus Baltobacteraceae bacterium]